MKKMLAIMLLMSLMTVSCNKDGTATTTDDPTQTTIEPTTDGSGDTTDPTTDDTADVPAPIPPSTSTLPALALSFKTNVLLYNLTASQEDKYNDAVALVKKVVGTEAFRKAVLNHTYNGSKLYANNNGLTNSQIYQSILDAAEKLTPAKNNTLDVGVKFYYTNNSVVGYTNGSITYINVNTKFFNNYDINEVAGNLFHEWLHKLGYGHDSSATARRPYSVPYAIGYMIRNLGKNFL
ncbi:MAG: hypothetical protein NDI69_05075 [Bacteriovoracaceae bacterium]|nr:hypothetical protein [Bacteriovoracaceae bacterium]